MPSQINYSSMVKVISQTLQKHKSHPKALLLSSSPSTKKVVLRLAGLLGTSQPLFLFLHFQLNTMFLCFLYPGWIELIKWSTCVEPKGTLGMQLSSAGTVPGEIQWALPAAQPWHGSGPGMNAVPAICVDIPLPGLEPCGQIPAQCCLRKIVTPHALLQFGIAGSSQCVSRSVHSIGRVGQASWWLTWRVEIGVATCSCLQIPSRVLPQVVLFSSHTIFNSRRIYDLPEEIWHV